MRDHDVTALTRSELDHARRERTASLALIRPGSPARVPIQARLTAIDDAPARPDHDRAWQQSESTGQCRLATYAS
jgi:hypothetical protein